MLNARDFSRFGAANVATAGRLLVTGHIANIFALAANADWDSETFKAVTDSAFCDQMRADIRAVKDCKATASGHVKFAVSNTKAAFDFFAGIMSRRDTYATAQDMVKAAYVQADAMGATTGASLSRLLKGKTAHEVKEEKNVESLADRRVRESVELESAKIATPIGLTALFDESINTVTQPEVSLSPIDDSASVTTLDVVESYIEESDSLATLTMLAELIASRMISIHAAMDSAVEKAERKAG